MSNAVVELGLREIYSMLPLLSINSNFLHMYQYQPSFICLYTLQLYVSFLINHHNIVTMNNKI